MNQYTKAEIINTIIGILKSKKTFNASFDGYESAHFFGLKIGLQARELVWLLFTLQDMFSVTFQENDILEEHCYCLDSMATLIQSKMSNRDLSETIEAIVSESNP